MIHYIFWSEQAKKREIKRVYNDGRKAMMIGVIVANLANAWNASDIKWAIASDDEINDLA